MEVGISIKLQGHDSKEGADLTVGYTTPPTCEAHDDARVADGQDLPRSRRPIHDRHDAVHEDRVEGLAGAEGVAHQTQRLHAVRGLLHCVAQPLRNQQLAEAGVASVSADQQRQHHQINSNSISR